MIRQMLKRQIVEDILSFTFLINFILIVGTVAAFSLIFLSDYRNQMADYAAKSAKNEQTLSYFSRDPQNNNSYANLQLVMKPRAERFISLSSENKSPQGFYFRMWPYELRVLSKKEDISGIGYYIPVTTREFVSPPTLFSPDLTFIVEFFLSFFAIILAFNAITGEKEAGTLRLIYANPAQRSHFIAAKYISAFLTLSLPLFLSLGVAAVIMGISQVVPLSTGFFYDLAMFALLSLLYLSVFVLIGLLCSAFSRTSNQSLVLGLVFWILLVVILPKSPGLLLDLKRFSVPTEEQMETLAKKAVQELQNKYEKEIMAFRNDQEALMKLINTVDAEDNEAQQRVRDDYLRKKIAAVMSLRKISMALPSSLYECAAASVAGTGIFHFEDFWTQARAYGNGFISFVKHVSGNEKPSSPFQFDIDSVTNKPIDYNSIPNFEEKDIKAGNRIKEALPFVGLLVLYNLFLFAFIFYKFQTYDVR